MKIIQNKTISSFALIGLATIILMMISFYNGYPLVYSDTGTYIGSGFEFVVPIDRPVSYGLFIKGTSLSYSLWLVVIVQNFLMAFLIYELFCLFKIKSTYIFAMAFLTFFTAVAWYSNQIMPDIFTPLLFISFFLLLFNTNYSLIKKIFLSILLIFASITHFSHLLIGLSLILSLLIIHLTLRKKLLRNKIVIPLKRIISISFIILSSWIVLLGINYSFESKIFISKSSHVFLMAHLIEKGILKRFLNENCDSEEFKNCKLCAFKDNLPIDGATFIWSPDGVFEKTGGWLHSKKEYDIIIKETMSRPKYLFDNIFKSFVFGFTQLTENSVGEGLGPCNEGTSPFYRVNEWFNDDLISYLNSKQNKWNGVNLNFDKLILLQWIVLILSLFIIIFLFSTTLYKKINALTIVFLIYGVMAIFMNAFITAGLTSPYSRLQSRVVWILPLSIIIIISNNFSTIKQFILKK